VKAIKLVIEKEKMDKKFFKMLVTGGGTYNLFLQKLLKEQCKEQLNLELVVPEKKVVNFKEALLMVLLGALRMEGLPNCFSSVTGGQRDTIGGAIYKGE